MNFSSLLDLYYASALDKIGQREIRLFASSNQKNGWLNFLTRSKAKPSDHRDHSGRDQVLEPVIGTSSAEKAFGQNAGKQGYETSSCCNPIPGDEVIGLIASDHLPIQIHRTNCPKAIELVSSFGNRVVKLNWINKESISFLSRVRLTGIDRMGMINDLTRIITSEHNLNIQSFHIEARAGLTEGEITLYVPDSATLNRLMKNLRHVEGIRNVTRSD